MSKHPGFLKVQAFTVGVKDSPRATYEITLLKLHYARFPGAIFAMALKWLDRYLFRFHGSSLRSRTYYKIRAHDYDMTDTKDLKKGETT